MRPISSSYHDININMILSYSASQKHPRFYNLRTENRSPQFTCIVTNSKDSTYHGAWHPVKVAVLSICPPSANARTLSHCKRQVRRQVYRRYSGPAKSKVWNRKNTATSHILKSASREWPWPPVGLASSSVWCLFRISMVVRQILVGGAFKSAFGSRQLKSESRGWHDIKWGVIHPYRYQSGHGMRQARCPRHRPPTADLRKYIT